jgi:hypothetical protein
MAAVIALTLILVISAKISSINVKVSAMLVFKDVRHAVILLSARLARMVTIYRKKYVINVCLIVNNAMMRAPALPVQLITLIRVKLGNASSMSNFYSLQLSYQV